MRDAMLYLKQVAWYIYSTQNIEEKFQKIHLAKYGEICRWISKALLKSFKLPR